MQFCYPETFLVPVSNQFSSAIAIGNCFSDLRYCRLVLSILELRINGIMQYVLFWLVSFKTQSCCFPHYLSEKYIFLFLFWILCLLDFRSFPFLVCLSFFLEHTFISRLVKSNSIFLFWFWILFVGFQIFFFLSLPLIFLEHTLISPQVKGTQMDILEAIHIWNIPILILVCVQTFVLYFPLTS